MHRRLLVLAVAAGTALVWVASHELRWPARALLAFLLVPVPVLLVLQARLVEQPALLPRTAVYASSGATQWVLAGITLAAALASGFSPLALGLGRPAAWGIQLAWAAGLTAAGVAIMLIARWLGVRESGLLAHLLPHTRVERAAFVGLSITAGFCEELIFRGFLIGALLTATGSLPLALLVAAIAFGIVHAYQDPSGVARATLLGLLLATPFVLTGSLLAPIIAHVAIDLVGGLWLGERLVR